VGGVLTATHLGRTFDYIPRLDPRNEAHRVTAAPVDLTLRSRYWTPGITVLDQGQEGACVGFGVAAEAAASPVRVRHVTDALAQQVYRRAKEVDEWEGVSYDGTSVRAGMLVGRDRGWWAGFRWAFNMRELRAALEDGPVVIGVTWLSEMYEAPGGIVTVAGQEVGGHCLLLTGYSPRHGPLRRPAYRWRNSWSKSYGTGGSAYVDVADLNRILFAAGNEAAVPIGRSTGKVTP
jgi:hypothetical protein